MRVLAFASQKSGAGKTTLAGHMAVLAQKSGMSSVALIDIDPEASLADWCVQRTELPLNYARATQADLLQKIESLRAEGTELVVIDTPAALGQSIEAALVVADLIAIPARPCAHDLDAASAIVELVQLSGKPFVFVINGVEADAELPPEVVMTLAQHGPVATTAIPRNIAFVEGMMDGRTVMEIGSRAVAVGQCAEAMGISGKTPAETGRGWCGCRAEAGGSSAAAGRRGSGQARRGSLFAIRRPAKASLQRPRRFNLAWLRRRRNLLRCSRPPHRPPCRFAGSSARPGIRWRRAVEPGGDAQISALRL